MSRLISAPFFSAHPVFSRAEYATAVNRRPQDRVVTAMLAQHLQAGNIRRVARGVFASDNSWDTHGCTGSSQWTVSEMIYKSKIDAWLVLVILGLPLGLLFGIAFGETTSTAELIIAVAAIGAVTLLFAWMVATTDYRFRDDSLHIRSGPLNWTIPLSGIRRIERSRSLIAGPALSLDRLLIHYGKHDWILISPKDKDGFISELDSRRQDRKAKP